MEKRFTELRFEQAGRRVKGLAVAWNQSADIGHFREKFERGSLKGHAQGVSLLFEHNPQRLLAKAPGTMELRETEKGLEFEAELPKSAGDIAELIQRGDISKVSIGFSVDKGGESFEDDLRTIKSATLWELSAVAKAARTETSIALRHAKAKAFRWSRLIIGV